jgi:hypothetical protein
MLTLVFAGGDTPAGKGRKVSEWLDDCGNIFAQAFSLQGFYWIDWPAVGVFAFSTGTREVLVWPKPNSQREAIVDAFCRVLKPTILQALEWQAIHASAAIGPTGLFAFCGPTGSGKSTLAFAMQQVGWRQFADDAVVLRLESDHVKACPLPFTPRLRSASRAQFADTSQPAAASLAESEETTLVAVFLLQQNSSLLSPRVSSIPRARAFPELLAHAHCFDAEDRAHTRRLMNDYLGIAARVHALRLEYPPNFEQLRQLTDAVMGVATGISSCASLGHAPLCEHVASAAIDGRACS